MSQPEGEPGASTPEEPLSRFLEGLHDHFATYRPQGSARWNFGTAFRRLEEAWGRTFAADRATVRGEAPDDDGRVTPATPAPRSVRASARQALDRVQSLSGRQVKPSAGAGAGAPDVDRTAEGFDATLEALRFLAARVDGLEREAATRDHPLDAMAWFEPDDSSSLLVAPLVEAVAASPGGSVLHVECGGGDLLDALQAAGIEARGVEPRGELALHAAGRGLAVEVGEAAAVLEALAPASQGAVVLSGVVDREPVPRLISLIDAALAALVPGGLLVVVSRGPRSVAGWPPVALDLLPGRPLHAETWELLLRRTGGEDLELLGDAPDGAGGPFAVTARKNR